MIQAESRLTVCDNRQNQDLQYVITAAHARLCAFASLVVRVVVMQVWVT